MNQFSCQIALNRDQIIYIAAKIATEETIQVLPFTVNLQNEIKAICPYCILDKRSDIKEFEDLKGADPWLSFFIRLKAKEHLIDVGTATDQALLGGLEVRGFTEQTRRARYAQVDTPTAKSLGFKGYKFDKHLFLPLSVHLKDGALRIGIANPLLLSENKFLSKASASWLFRARATLPHPMPDLLPLSTIGDMKISETILAPPNGSAKTMISPFLHTLSRRLNKRVYRDKIREQKLADQARQLHEINTQSSENSLSCLG